MEFFNSLIHALGGLVLSVAVWLTFAITGLGPSVVVTNTAPLPATHVMVSATSTLTSSAATTTKKVTAPAKKKPATPVPPATAPAPQPPVTITNDMITQANAQTRESVVNILCTFRTTNTSSYISGSGLIVDPRGVVLTNAHVAQFFLLQNYLYPGSTSCVIRTGSPASPSYTAQLLYLPPAWIDTNASQVTSDHATGTGERDYAFLLITGSTQFGPALPSSFSALSLSTASPKENEPVLLAGYPAGFLGGNEIQRSLYISSAVSKVGQLYTFNSAQNVDLVSVGGTVIAQSGSSGGAVVDLTDDKLIGLIATESEGTTTASRDLRAVTLAHVDRSLKEDGKGGLASLLSGDLIQASKDFNATVAPALTKKLADAIEK